MMCVLAWLGSSADVHDDLFREDLMRIDVGSQTVTESHSELTNISGHSKAQIVGQASSKWETI